MTGTFTAHTLPILANWSQFLGSATLVTGAVAFYVKHRCHTCHRLARFLVGPHHVPTCHRHRQTVELDETGLRGGPPDHDVR